ncbi:hypothetical protein [Oceanithermus sp.]
MFRDGDLHLRPLVPLAEWEGELNAPEGGAEAWVVPAWVEEEFYQLNNLRFQIERLFAGVWGVRVDEEALARAADAARELVRGSYLVAERAEAFVAVLPRSGAFRLRRPEGGAEEEAEGPLEALWALKRVWAARWSLDEVIRRGAGGWPEPAPVVVIAKR